jgi:triphosphoribosyl-dephospho-CoA synthase
MISVGQLSELYQQACELELQAFKPGNVSVYADGHDMTVADFRVSAKASAQPIVNPAYCLGEKIYYALRATRQAVGCNTNLGIILLCAPLIQAFQSIRTDLSLRQSLTEVLAQTTILDADWAFQAIALAAPGGLGSSEKQDVRDKAAVTLADAMALACARDRIALQYVTQYQDIFDFSLGLYYNALGRWGDQAWAAVAVYVGLLSRFPDSHIERKYGNQHSDWVMARMAMLNHELTATESPEQFKPLLYHIDQELKSKGVNPGTTADLTVATVLTAFLEERLCSNRCSCSSSNGIFSK